MAEDASQRQREPVSAPTDSAAYERAVLARLAEVRRLSEQAAPLRHHLAEPDGDAGTA